jgi:hypothetical protein
MDDPKFVVSQGSCQGSRTISSLRNHARASDPVTGMTASELHAASKAVVGLSTMLAGKTG